MVEQDVEGSLEIVATQMDSYDSAGNVTGICQDFFEFRMVSIYYMKRSTEWYLHDAYSYVRIRCLYI